MIMNDIRYPNIKAKLTGTDGNAYAILGRVLRALREAGVDEERSASSPPRRPPATTTTCCRPACDGSTPREQVPMRGLLAGRDGRARTAKVGNSPLAIGRARPSVSPTARTESRAMSSSASAG